MITAARCAVEGRGPVPSPIASENPSSKKSTRPRDLLARGASAALAAAASDGLEDGAAAISLVQNSGRRVLSGRPVTGGAMDDEDPGCVDRAVAGLSQAVDSNVVDMMLAEEMEMSLTQASVDLEYPTE